MNNIAFRMAFWVLTPTATLSRVFEYEYYGKSKCNNMSSYSSSTGLVAFSFLMFVSNVLCDFIVMCNHLHLNYLFYIYLHALSIQREPLLSNILNIVLTQNHF